MPRPPEPTPAEDLNAAYAYGFPLWVPRRGGGSRRVLVSDPWGFGRYTLAYTSSAAVKRKVRAFWDQAEDFYWAAEKSSPSAQPLLYYYSFMNMVKAFLTIRGRLVHDYEVHGVRYQRPARQKGQIKTQELVVEGQVTNRTVIFSEFAAQLGHTFATGAQLKVGPLFQQVVGVHRAWMDVNDDTSNFARASVHLGKNINASTVFARVSFSSRDKSVAEAVARRSGWKRVHAQDTSQLWYETAPEPRQGRSYVTSVERLAQGLHQRGMHVLLTENEGYRLYFSDLGRLESQRLPQLVSLYALMFFLGSITRYRPYDFDRFVEGKWGWLVSEFVNSQPAQFVYLMASEMVGNEVVRPFGHVTIESP